MSSILILQILELLILLCDHEAAVLDAIVSAFQVLTCIVEQAYQVN
jgi:hypothetical protein